MPSKKDILRARLQAKFSGGHKALVFGLGTTGGGVGVARFLAHLGFSVTVTDLKNERELKVSLAKLRKVRISRVLGRHRKIDIDRADFVVKNPGVPDTSSFIRYAKKKNKIITSDADIFMALVSQDRLIGVTGTKGKTTTTRLLAHTLGASAVAVGIPGISFFEIFNKKTLPRWIVAEFSSFDLEYAAKSPGVAVFTSLFADHLNRYKSFRDYAATKMRLLRFQQRGDVAFLLDSKKLRSFVPKTHRGEIFWIKAKDGANEHGISLASIALANAVSAKLGVKQTVFQKRLSSFQLQPGCMEIVKRRSRIFVNSTTATNPGSAAFIVKTLAARHPGIVVIVGGEDKKFPEDEIADFARVLKRYAGAVVTLPGTFTERLAKHLDKRIVAESMEDAVRQAARIKKSIVLAPAAASFNMFENEFDRGRQFIRAVKKIK